MWGSWLFAVLTYASQAKYLKFKDREYDSFARPFDSYPIGMIVFSIVICAGLRWVMSRIDKPYLMLLPFWAGLFFSILTSDFGYFLLPDFCVVFQILGFALLLVFFPPLLRTKPRIFPTGVLSPMQ